ncbi:hypothetical protein [uncultured Rhodoblastus sp.]|uniref:hypothetical protein n=1 Tax=uncultured Rhodoblastus sp. TaxID=543037 RepID=UPI0025FF8F47|nr:hypothetical protein [uncultured Rhodoblastus sp.]
MTPKNAADQTAADAANLLLRLGQVVAFVVAPAALLLSQRSIFILTPIAGALILAGGMVLAPRMRMRDLFGFVASPIGLAALFLSFWALASLLWTPFPAEAAPRLLKIFSTFLAILPVAAALPARSKAAYLYLLPLGVALAAVGALVLGAPFFSDPDDAENNEILRRAAQAMLILLWPALAATALRDRLTLSGSLAIVALTAAISVHIPSALAATALGTLAFAAARSDPRRVGRWIGALFAGCFVFAPALPLLFGPFLGSDATGPLQSLKLWHGMIVNDGFRLLAGHGFNFVGSGFMRGYLPVHAPHSMLFEAWTDLGMVGALGGGALIYLCFKTAAAESPRLSPYWLGGLTYVTAMGVFGAATLQLWWITALALGLGAFIVARRGDYKTDRPTAPKQAA